MQFNFHHSKLFIRLFYPPYHKFTPLWGQRAEKRHQMDDNNRDKQIKILKGERSCWRTKWKSRLLFEWKYNLFDWWGRREREKQEIDRSWVRGETTPLQRAEDEEQEEEEGGQRAINPSYWPTALWEVEGRKGGGIRGGSEVTESQSH